MGQHTPRFNAAFNTAVEERFNDWSNRMYSNNSYLFEIGATAREEQRDRIRDQLEREWRSAGLPVHEAAGSSGPAFGTGGGQRVAEPLLTVEDEQLAWALRESEYQAWASAGAATPVTSKERIEREEDRAATAASMDSWHRAQLQPQPPQPHPHQPIDRAIYLHGPFSRFRTNFVVFGLGRNRTRTNTYTGEPASSDRDSPEADSVSSGDLVSSAKIDGFMRRVDSLLAKVGMSWDEVKRASSLDFGRFHSVARPCLTDHDCQIVGYLACTGGLESCQSLSLRSSRIGDSGMVALCDVLAHKAGAPVCRGLKTLDLSDCQLGDSGCTALEKCLKEGALDHLSTIYLYDNRISDAAKRRLQIAMMSADGQAYF